MRSSSMSGACRQQLFALLVCNVALSTCLRRSNTEGPGEALAKLQKTGSTHKSASDKSERVLIDDPEGNDTDVKLVIHSPSCGNNPDCKGMPGLCCPTDHGKMLACCITGAERISLKEKISEEKKEKHEEAVAMTRQADAAILKKEMEDQAHQQMCGAHAKCREVIRGEDLKAACCPTQNGNMLECCDDKPMNKPTNKSFMVSDAGKTRVTTCSAHPKCRVAIRPEDWEGDCCPTKRGNMLGCCESEADAQRLVKNMLNSSASGHRVLVGTCRAHDQCAQVVREADLDDECCPTKKGIMLGCCSNETAPLLSRTASDVTSAMCAAHKECARTLRQEDQGEACCPAKNGRMLSCCDQSVRDSSTRPVLKIDAQSQCSLYSACAAMQLTGECCPNADGRMHECCAAGLAPAALAAHNETSAIGALSGPVAGEALVDRACSAHSSCDGISGLCCPMVTGEMLECCGLPSKAPSKVVAPKGTRPVEASTLPAAVGRHDGGSTTHDVPRSSPVQKMKAVVALDSACEAHPLCADLQGECCPAANGTHLDCCHQKQPIQQKAKVILPACSEHPFCTGMSGDCCPNVRGTMLGCCETESPKPEALHKKVEASHEAKEGKEEKEEKVGRAKDFFNDAAEADEDDDDKSTEEDVTMEDLAQSHERMKDELEDLKDELKAHREGGNLNALRQMPMPVGPLQQPLQMPLPMQVQQPATLPQFPQQPAPVRQVPMPPMPMQPVQLPPVPMQPVPIHPVPMQPVPMQQPPLVYPQDPSWQWPSV